MKIRAGRAIATTVALTAATLMATAGVASAGPPPPGDGWDHVWNGEGVRVYVEEYGDWVSVCDTEANGYGASVYVETVSAVVVYEITTNGGYGSCKTVHANMGGKYNLPEKETYYLNYWGAYMGLGWSYFKNDH